MDLYRHSIDENRSANLLIVSSTTKDKNYDSRRNTYGGRKIIEILLTVQSIYTKGTLPVLASEDSELLLFLDSQLFFLNRKVILFKLKSYKLYFPVQKTSTFVYRSQAKVFKGKTLHYKVSIEPL